MLWHKAWLETRWRFFIGLGLLVCSAIAVVLIYPRVAQLLATNPVKDIGGPLGERIRETVELAKSFRGYIWSNWFSQNLLNVWTILAALLGSGGPLSPASGLLFTLSLPVSRTRLLAVRAATSLGQLLILSLLPSLLIPLVASTIGESYSFGSALVHGLCLFVAGSLIFSFAFLLSSVFNDLWRPLLITLSIAGSAGFFAQISREFAVLTPFPTMTGEAYFRAGSIPWLGLAVSVAASALLFAATLRTVARRDF